MATIVVGPYTEYEKPPDLLVTFTDNTNTALDISGMSIEATWMVSGATTDNSFAGSLDTDGTDGVAAVPWGTVTPSPFDEPGTILMEVWASDGTTRYASERIRFKVRAAVALTEPSI